MSIFYWGKNKLNKNEVFSRYFNFYI